MKTISQAVKVAALSDMLGREALRPDLYLTPRDFSLDLYRVVSIEGGVTLLEQQEPNLRICPVEVADVLRRYAEVPAEGLVEAEPIGSATSNELRGTVEVSTNVPHPSGQIEFRGR